MMLGVGARRSYQTDNEQKQKEKEKKRVVSKKQTTNVRFILRIQLDNNQVRLIWEMVRVAIHKVPRIRASQGAICQFCSWAGKAGVPPLKEAGWVACGDIGMLTLGSRSYVEFGGMERGREKDT